MATVTTPPTRALRRTVSSMRESPAPHETTMGYVTKTRIYSYIIDYMRVHRAIEVIVIRCYQCDTELKELGPYLMILARTCGVYRSRML